MLSRTVMRSWLIAAIVTGGSIVYPAAAASLGPRDAILGPR